MTNLAIAQQSNSSIAQFDRHTAIAVAVEKRNTLVEFVKAVMQKDCDYGAIPGTDKPTLLKPGAEKLCTLFNYLPAYEVVEKVEDWTGENHGGEPFFFYHYRALISDQAGRVIATGEGSVNSWEKKYRYRDAKPTCPHCGQQTVNKSKKPGEGYYCWAKIGGCGATFKEGDPAIVSQPTGKIPNPDIFDAVNTMMKMAQKRALVSAVLLACNASEFFTQDMEDMAVIDADIVTTAPRSAPLRYETSEFAKRRIADLMQRTGFSVTQIESIASKQKPPIDLDSMPDSDVDTLRNGVYASWGAEQPGAFKAKSHAWNAFQKLLTELEPETGDKEIWEAWQMAVSARTSPATVEAQLVEEF